MSESFKNIFKYFQKCYSTHFIVRKHYEIIYFDFKLHSFKI